MSTIQLVRDTQCFTVILFSTLPTPPRWGWWNGQHPRCHPSGWRSHLSSAQVHLVHEVWVLPKAVPVWSLRGARGAWWRSEEERRCHRLRFNHFWEDPSRHAGICPTLHLHRLMWTVGARSQAKRLWGPGGTNPGEDNGKKTKKTIPSVIHCHGSAH